MSSLKKLLAKISVGVITLTQLASTVVYGQSTTNATFDPEFSGALQWMYSNALTRYNTENQFRPYDTLTREQAARFFVEFTRNVVQGGNQNNGGMDNGTNITGGSSNNTGTVNPLPGLTGNNMTGSTNTGSINTGSINTGSTMTGNTMTGTNMTGSTMTGTNMTGSSLTGGTNTGSSTTGTLNTGFQSMNSSVQHAAILDTIAQLNNGTGSSTGTTDLNILNDINSIQTLQSTGTTSTSCTFTDMNSADPTLRTYITQSCELGLFKGFQGRFMPTQPLTKAQAITVLVRSIEGMQDESVTPWWDNYFKRAQQLGLTKETNTNALNRSVMRGEVALMLYRAGNPGSTTGTGNGTDLGDLLGDLLGGNNTGTNNTGGTVGGNNTGVGTGNGTVGTGTTGTTNLSGGTLQIALSPNSPSSQSIPSVGTVVFGRVDLQAGGGDIAVNSIRLAREGLGQRTDIQRVWMERDNMRITSRQTVGSDNSVILTFSPSLVVRANSTTSLDIVASLSGSSTNSQHRFTIPSAADVQASATTVQGSFPLSTAFMTTSSYQVASVAFTSGGTASNYNVGDRGVELGQFKLQNNAVNDINVVFRSITLRNEGNGDMTKNLSGLSIYKGSTLVSSGVSFDGKNVTFRINNDNIAFGRQETYYIRGDILGVDNTAGDNYQFSLRYSDDISVVEQGTLFQTRITGADNTVTMASYSVRGGDIVLSRNTSVTSSQTVAPGANDVVLWSANLNVNQPVNLGDMTVSLNSGAGYSGTLANLATSFNTLRLRVGNNVVSTYTPASSSANSFVFEGNFSVNANTTIQILGNVRSNAIGRFLISEIGFANFGTREYSTNGNAIQSTQFVGSVGGVVTTMGSADITWTRNDGIPNQSIVGGASDRTLLQFVARANDVSDVTISRLRFTAAGGTSGFNNTYLTNLRLYSGNQVISTKSFSPGNADFNDINVSIARNSDVTFRVVGDFSTAATTGSAFQIALSGAGSVEARDINSLTLTEDPGLQGPIYTFTNAGAATVSLNSSSPTSRLLTATGSDVEVSRYTFAATTDNLRLTDLYLYNAGTADLSANVSNIGIYDVNGTRLAGGSVLGTGIVSFSLGSNSNFIIPKNSSNTVLVVRASFNDITSSNNDAQTLQLGIGTGNFNVSTVNGTSNGVRLVSESIGNTVSDVVLSNPLSNTHLLVRSKPTVATSAPATNSTHTFSVTADANNRVSLNGLTMNVSNPSGGPQTFTLYRDIESAGNVVTTGSFTNGSVTISFPGGVEISAGSTRTFVLVVSDLAGTPTVNSKRIVRITDMSYIDVMDIGSNVTISNLSQYGNVGLPTAESTFTY